MTQLDMAAALPERSKGRHATLVLIVTASLLCGWQSSARAATVYSITLENQGPVAQSADNPLVKLYDANNHLVTQAYVSQAGAFNWSIPGGGTVPFTANPTDTDDFISFCIELTQDISFGHTYKVDAIDLSAAPIPGSGPLGSGMGSPAAALIEELWASQFNGIFTSTNPNASAAAFQLAIWKLEYDGGTTYNFSQGSLQASGSISSQVMSLATSMLSSIDPTGNGTKANLLALTGHEYYDSYGKLVKTPFQDQVVALPPSPPPGNVVPEPSSLMLCAIGGLGMAAARRGRRRGQ